MANWKFTDDYGKTFPSLQESILSLLVFSDHSLNGTTFKGVLDVGATGIALKIIGAILGVNNIAVSGTVEKDDQSLKVTLRSSDDAAFTEAMAKAIPLIGGKVTQKAWMDIKTVANTSDPADAPPPTDIFDLGITIAIGRGTVDITAEVPMGSGFFFIQGEFNNFGITLEDLNFMMGSLSGDNAWFPTTELGPYSAGQTSFGLLSMSLVCNVTFTPSFSITISSFDVAVGISKLPIMGKALYLDPLGVWVTITSPLSSPSPTWGLMGTMKLLNYQNPGPGGLDAPDFTFDFSMSFPTSTNKNFGISASMQNPSAKPVSLMLKNLMGPSTDVGIGDKITVNSFELETNADVSKGTISDFYTSVVMSGGFGLFEKIPVSVEEMAISVTYTSD